MIKRRSGPHADAAAQAGGKTLAEKLAEVSRVSRAADAGSDEASKDAALSEEDEQYFDEVEAEEEAPRRAGHTPAKYEPEAELEPEPEPEPAAEEPAADAAMETDEIVRRAKAMRGNSEVSQERTKTCLIVEDSRVVRKISSKIASSLGFHVIEAENGAEGLARCKQQMPDFILTDWQMPVMSGIEFVIALRAIPTPRAPTIVFCTSKGEATHIHEGIAAGADDYIVKPFKEHELKAKLMKTGVNSGE